MKDIYHLTLRTYPSLVAFEQITWTREKAVANDLIKYKGKVCKTHPCAIGVRYTNSGRCIWCVREGNAVQRRKKLESSGCKMVEIDDYKIEMELKKQLDNYGI